MSFNGDLYPTAGADVVMTTSGDMVKYESGARKRLGIGSANQILQVKSSLPSWETLSTAGSILTTQGDVLIEGAAGLERLGQSTDGFVLTTKGASANPVWAAAGGGKAVALGASSVTAGTSMSVTGLSASLDNDYSSIQINWNGVSGGTRGDLGLLINGSTNNNYDYIRQDAGTMEAGLASSQATFELIESSGSGSYYFGGVIQLCQFTSTNVWISSLSCMQYDSSAFVGGYAAATGNTTSTVTSVEVLGVANYTGTMSVSGIER